MPLSRLSTNPRPHMDYLDDQPLDHFPDGQLFHLLYLKASLFNAWRSLWAYSPTESLSEHSYSIQSLPVLEYFLCLIAPNWNRPVWNLCLTSPLLTYRPMHITSGLKLSRLWSDETSQKETASSVNSNRSTNDYHHFTDNKRSPSSHDLITHYSPSTIDRPICAEFTETARRLRYLGSRYFDLDHIRTMISNTVSRGDGSTDS